MGGFNNPVVGALALVRKAIRSPNYQAGAAGWTINQDGSAEFNDVVVRGEVDVVGTDGSRVKVDSNSGQAEIELQPPSEPGATYNPAVIGTASAPDKSAWLLLTSPNETHSGSQQAQIQLEGSDGTTATSIIQLLADLTEVVGDLTVDGRINPFAGFTNMVTDTALITPSAANTPTSLTVNYGPLTGATFLGQISAATTVPGTQVTGVGITSVTATSAILWVTRTNTTATRVNYMVWGV